MGKIENRKDEHLDINLQKDVSSGVNTGFEHYAFNHCALPEIDLSTVSTTTTFLSKTLGIPLLISSMTGGTEKGDRINLRLAEAANLMKIAMGVGSQRAEIENFTSGIQSKIRKIAPDIPLYANLGAIQLNYGFSIDQYKRAVDYLRADALILHLNPLQEALQPEGETNFSGLTEKIEKVCRQIEIPVIVKEVGWGISGEVARRLIDAGVSAVDIAGAGGTSWSEVEKYRNQDENRYQIASAFKDWGIPTSDCLLAVRKELPDYPIIASGGIKNGIEIAKSIALGANLVGIARPFLLAAHESTEAVIGKIEKLKKELSITMFAAGAKDIDTLSKVKLSLKAR